MIQKFQINIYNINFRINKKEWLYIYILYIRYAM